MTAVEEIRLLMQQYGVDGLGTIVLGTIGVMPAAIPSSSPDVATLSIIEPRGSDASRTHNGATERPSFVLVSRARTYPVASAMAFTAYRACGGADGLYRVRIGGTFYQSLVPRQCPADIGLDAAGRIMFSFTIETEKSPT